MLTLRDFRVEYRLHPLGLDAICPRLSWKLVSDQKGTMQKSYRLKMSNGWDTGMVRSNQNVCVCYDGPALEAQTEYYLFLEVKDNHGNTASAETSFETGLIAQEQHRTKCEERLLDNLKHHKNHLSTGFAGTPYLCPTLSAIGRHDTAGTVFLKDDCPSWLYHVKLGATTMWELWDGVNPDGSFNRFEMNSLNHYSYGSIGEWVYHDLLGLKLK